METELLKAAERNDIEEVRRLLKAGANINAADDYQDTALHIAAERGYKDMMLFLLNHNVLPNRENVQGLRPFNVIIEHNEKSSAHKKVEMLLLLSQFGEETIPIIMASCATFDKADILKEFLNRGFSPDVRAVDNGEKSDYTPAMCAIEGNSPAALKVLLDYGANVKITWNNKSTDLFWFAHFHENAEVISVLEQYQLDIEANHQKRSPDITSL